MSAHLSVVTTIPYLKPYFILLIFSIIGFLLKISCEFCYIFNRVASLFVCFLTVQGIILLLRQVTQGELLATSLVMTFLALALFWGEERGTSYYLLFRSSI